MSISSQCLSKYKKMRSIYPRYIPPIRNRQTKNHQITSGKSDVSRPRAQKLSTTAVSIILNIIQKNPYINVHGEPELEMKMRMDEVRLRFPRKQMKRMHYHKPYSLEQTQRSNSRFLDQAGLNKGMELWIITSLFP